MKQVSTRLGLLSCIFWSLNRKLLTWKYVCDSRERVTKVKLTTEYQTHQRTQQNNKIDMEWEDKEAAVHDNHIS